MKKNHLNINSYEIFKRINESPTNRSSSKQAHAFSKSPRFSPRRPTCPEYSYTKDLSVQKQKSGVSIGYGKKSDFTRDLTCSPGVGKYYIKHFCDENLSKKFSIGLGRKEISYRSYISKQILKNPGSNKYRINSQNRSRSPRYSMRQKTVIIDKSKTIQPQNQNPGPSDYNCDLPEIYNKKKYSISKSRRFQRIRTDIPGPGYYDEQSKQGKYILSSFHGAPSTRFNKSIKKTLIDDAIKISIKLPGPGSYRYSSEFGNYDQ